MSKGVLCVVKCEILVCNSYSSVYCFLRIDFRAGSGFSWEG